MIKRVLILFVAAIVLCSCGFKPLYQQQNAMPYKTKIFVTTYEDAKPKLVFLLNDYLKQEFSDFSNPEERYHLNITVNRTSDSYETQSNTVNLRTRITLTASYQLHDIKEDKILLEDVIIASDSYEESTSPYATLVSYEEIDSKMIKSIVKEMKLRISAKLL